MLSWSQKQKLKFLGWAGVFVFALAGVALLILSEGPNCANGKQDGDERGTDCGGSCRFVCEGDALDPLVVFARAVPVADSVWGAVAYVENRNKDAGAYGVPYVFKLYDEHSLLLYERRGTAYLPPNKAVALFEGRMETGSRTPARASFAFESPPRFERLEAEPELGVRVIRFESGERQSRLLAGLDNPLLFPLGRVEAVALLFDADGTVFAASSSVLPRLPAQAETVVSFTWPGALPAPARIEVLYTAPGR